MQDTPWLVADLIHLTRKKKREKSLEENVPNVHTINAFEAAAILEI